MTRGSVLGRGDVRRVLGWVFQRLHAGPVDVDLWGVPVRLFPDGNVSEKKALLNPDRFNPRELSCVVESLPSSGGVFVDVGANVGLFSLYAARYAPPGVTIVAYEPHPELFRRMEFNLQGEGPGRLEGEVDLRLKQLALGARDGQIFLQSDPTELGSGRIVEGAGEFAVQIASLKKSLDEESITRIDVLKIDVEGYEDRVLLPFFRDAPETLWPRAIIIEYVVRDEWETDCIKECESLGYVMEILSQSNAVLRYRPGGCA